MMESSDMDTLEMDENGETMMISNDSEMTRPQSQPLSRDQVMNSAGGFAWQVDDWTRLKRFLCLGAESGTYYVNPDKLKKQNVKCVKRLIHQTKGKEVVETIRKYSVEGRVARQNAILLGLAMCARSEDEETKAAAYGNLRDVCRIPTHLFQFVENCQEMSKSLSKAEESGGGKKGGTGEKGGKGGKGVTGEKGEKGGKGGKGVTGETGEKEETGGTGWGRAHRKAICNWYNSFAQSPLKLAMLVTKYWNRESWTHRDVIRLCHIKPVNEAIGFIIRYVTKGLEEAKKMYIKEDTSEDSHLYKVCVFLEAVEKAKAAEDDERLVQLIRQHRLAREHCPTKLLNSKLVWSQLLEDMPLTAMIRNLGKMSKEGLLEPGSPGEARVLAALADQQALVQARVHPFTVLNALFTYRQGRGVRGKLNWTVNQNVLDALDRAFYAAFQAVQPTGRRFLLALDVSGSMSSPCLGSSLPCCSAAAAMLMVCLHTEPLCDAMAFASKFVPLDVSRENKLEEVVNKTTSMNFGTTDCAQPMLWALENEKKYDVFIVYTDSETWAGKVHPAEALRRYRKETGLWQARLIVVAMTSSGFSIADPEDPGMLDVCGFDTAVPDAMRAFILGEV